MCTTTLYRNDTITLPMYPIINRSFNTHIMSWEIVHRLLTNPSEIVIKAMCFHQTLTGPTKQSPKKINEAPCTVFVTAKGNI